MATRFRSRVIIWSLVWTTNMVRLALARPWGTTKNVPVDTSAQEQLGQQLFIGLLVGFGTLSVIMVSVAGLCYRLSLRPYKLYNTPRKQFEDLLEDKEHVATDLNTLKNQCTKLLMWRPDDGDVEEPTEMKQFLAGIIDKQAEDAEATGGKLETLKGVRNEALPIRQENRVKVEGASQDNLHISKLSDFYSNPVYLCQAPLPAQFVDQWKAIWQEKIGVLVWIGRLVVDGQVRMDCYIADLGKEAQGRSVTHGDFTITTFKVEEQQSRYNMYNLTVQRGAEKREVILLHLYEWLQSTVSWALRRDVQTLLVFKREHCYRIRKNLPGIMFQCRQGTAGSATMLAAYIGYQTFLRHRKVNIYGILKYIRRHRYGAFEMTGDPHHTFLLQIQIAYAVTSEMAKFALNGDVPIFESWIKKIWCADHPKKAAVTVPKGPETKGQETVTKIQSVSKTGSKR